MLGPKVHCHYTESMSTVLFATINKLQVTVQIVGVFWVNINGIMLTRNPVKLDVHESVYHDTIMKVTNKMQLYRLIYFSLSALCVLGDLFAHHQEHLTVFTVCGSIHPDCCWLVYWMS